MGALLDTNVLLDALANREPWAAEAKDLLFLAACGKLQLFVSGSTITDLFYLVNRYVTHDRRKSRKIIDTIMESLPVVNVGMRECLFAAYSSVADYEDAVVVEAARSARLDCIVTRNLKDYEGADFPVMSPREYLDSQLAGS